MTYNNGHLGIWRSDTGMSWSRSMVLVGWRYREITSSFFLATTNIWSGTQSNVINLHFVSEVRPEVVRDISISRYQLELFSLLWGREKYNILLPLRFVVTYICPVRSRRRACSIKVKDGWFVGLFIYFFNLGEQQVNVLLLNSEQSACDE